MRSDSLQNCPDRVTGTTLQVSKYITPSQMVVVSTKACVTGHQQHLNLDFDVHAGG